MVVKRLWYMITIFMMVKQHSSPLTNSHLMINFFIEIYFENLFFFFFGIFRFLECSK